MSVDLVKRAVARQQQGSPLFIGTFNLTSHVTIFSIRIDEAVNALS
jgi:hypothetical protein